MQSALECFKKRYQTPDGLKENKYCEEGLVDHLSLEIAHDAFRWYTRRKKIVKFPMTIDLSLEKMFFVTRAYALCWALTHFDLG